MENARKSPPAVLTDYLRTRAAPHSLNTLFGRSTTTDNRKSVSSTFDAVEPGQPDKWRKWKVQETCPRPEIAKYGLNNFRTCCSWSEIGLD